MNAKVDLEELAEQIQMQSDNMAAYLHKPTGELVCVSDEVLMAAEEDESDDDLEDWEREDLELAKRIIETDEYLQLPSKWDVHEYGMMEDFCGSAEDERMRQTLLNSIQGKGAFHRFKENAIRFGLIDEWYEFRDEAYQSFAKKWCEGHDIPYTLKQEKSGSSELSP
ncbi:MAG: hypothetical protein HY961_12785 [Ignavibacteriae bacterium]|nr:hypothetical protein [Ignavibacteriota bacterium]